MSHNTFGNVHRYPKLNPYAGLKGNIPVRYEDIYMGIEVEAENIEYHAIQIPGSFKAVQDGSLKLQGMEFVTVPIKLLYLEKELERLFGSIKDASFSSRTSIHVHMNARDFTLQNLIDFLKVYVLFERNLYKFSGDRWTNNFCIPLQQSPDRLINFLNYCESYTGDEVEAHIMGNTVPWSKYLGLNISPITGTPECPNKYGTIEFRQMKGNNNIRHIIDWCNIIACIKFYVRSMDSKELHTLIMNNKGHTIVKDVFRNWTPLIIPDKDTSDIQESNSFLKYCIEFSKTGVRSVIANPSVDFEYRVMSWNDFSLIIRSSPRIFYSMRDEVPEDRVPTPSSPTLRELLDRRTMTYPQTMTAAGLRADLAILDALGRTN